MSEINIIPLVDISLVLLIIFMVTANYIMTSSFVVDIPKTTHAQAVTQNDAVSIGISRKGLVYLGAELVTVDELQEELQRTYRANANMSVILSVDENANFKSVARIIDVLSGIGIGKIKIATVNQRQP